MRKAVRWGNPHCATSPQVGSGKGDAPRRGQLRHRGLLLAFAAVGAVTGAVAGELEFDVPQNVVSNYPTAIGSDVSSIVKKGEGKLYLNQGTAINAFAGAITVENGVLGADDPQNFGKPSSVTVEKGGTLDLSPKDGSNTGSIKNAKVYLAGYGYANQGALRRTTGTMQDGLLNGFTLTDDTLVYNTTRFGTTGTIDFDGHYLEKQGPGGEFLLNGCTFKNFGGIILDGGNNGYLTLQSNCTFGGDSNNLFIGKSGVLSLWNTPDLGKAPPWKLVVTNYLWLATGDQTKNRNAWDGPVEIASGKTLTVNPQNSGSTIKIGGAMNNKGTLDKKSPGTLMICGDYQGGAINHYAGDLIFTGDGKKREIGQVTLANLSGPARLAYENAGRIHHTGANVWLASGNNANPAVMSVTNSVCDGWYSSTHSSQIFLGSDSPYGGLLTVDAGSAMSNRLEIGRSGFGGVFQRGGDVYWQIIESVKYDYFADNGYGFYGMDAGTLTIDNWFRTAYGAQAARSFLVQRGGTMTVKGQVQLAAKGRAELYVANGTAKANGMVMGFNDYYDAAGGGATLTVAKGGTLDFGRSGVYFQHKNGFDAVVNLNDGGTLWTARMNAGVVGGAGVYYNFNGGKLCPTQAWGFTDQWDPSGNDPAQATIYDGGLTVDPSRCASDKDYARFPFSLKKATGMGVASIELPPADSEFWKCNFFGPTRVIISGKGKAATALVDFDLWTKKPRGVIVTGAGFDYDESTTAKVESWDGKTTYPCKVTMFTHKGTGGLTLTGSMGLTLPTVCTYGGPTTVESGTLTFEKANVYPEQSPLVLRPAGTVDFKNFPRTFVSITGAGKLNNCNATVTNELCFYVADLKNGNALRLTGSLTLGANAKVRILDPENLDDSIKSLTLAVANGGVYGSASPTFEGANPDDWHVTVHGNNVRFGRRRGFGIFVR